MLVKRININLPWPPSVNSLYRINRRSRIFKSKKAVDYTATVGWTLKRAGFEGFGMSRVEIDILACPPDRRKRDLDNIQKALLDSLQEAGLFKDDCQVDKITITRGKVIKKGNVFIQVKERRAVND